MRDIVLWVGLAAVFFGIVGVIVASMSRTTDAGVARSLAAVEALKAAPDSMRQELDRPFNDRVTRPFLARLTRMGRRLTPSDQAARFRRKLDLAGNPPGWDSDRILAFKMLGLLLGAAFGFLLGLILGGFGWLLVLTIGLALAGFFLPNLVLYQVAYNRSEQILKDLPDALDLLVISATSAASSAPWCRPTPSASRSPTCCASRRARCASAAPSGRRRRRRRCP